MNQIAALLVLAAGQGDVRSVKVDDFESNSTSGWLAVKADSSGFGEDALARVALSSDADPKQGKRALAYSYEVTPGTMRVLTVSRPWDLSKMRSLDLWIRTSHATAVIIGLAQRGGASFQTGAYCAQGIWQEIAVNLDEFAPAEPAKYPGAKLDLAQVESLHISDISGFLAAILPELKGSRSLWINDVVFSSKPVAHTTGPLEAAKLHVVDNFESPVIRWIPLSMEFVQPPKIGLFDSPLLIDAGEAPPDGGKQSLKFSYTRQAAKAYGIMRNLEKVDLAKATGFDLCLRTSCDGTYIVAIEEKTGARYQRTVELKAEDGWKRHSWPLAEFTLADDSKDDKNALDPARIKQVTIADISGLAGADAGTPARLWVDEVRFALSQ